MANPIRHMTSTNSIVRSGCSPGRRFLSAVLCSALIVSSVFPAFAVAGEGDSEGEGTGTTIEVPVGPPELEPGGEETELEDEGSAESEEEGGAVEAEVETETPAPESVAGIPPEAPAEAVPSAPGQPTYVPAPEPSQPETAPASESGPVAGATIEAPPQTGTKAANTAHAEVSPESAAPPQAPPPTEPAQPEAPPASPRSPQSTPVDPGRIAVVGKDTYVVRPGDCLWQIASDLLGPGANMQAIEEEVGRLWRLNEARIGTGDPSLIYAGTELRLR